MLYLFLFDFSFFKIAKFSSHGKVFSYLYEVMDVNLTVVVGSPCQSVIRLYTLNLYDVVYQLSLNKTEREIV